MEQSRVIVVGSGNAALVAALSAHEAGGNVTIVEAAPREEGGGNSRFSGGIFRFAHDGLEDLRALVGEAAIPPDSSISVDPYPVETYRSDLHTASAGRHDPVLTEVLVGKSADTVAWMRDRGVRWELTTGKLIDPTRVGDAVYRLPPGGAVRSRNEGIGLVDDLLAAVDHAGIEMRYGSPAHALMADGSQVRGVQIRHRDHFEDLHGAVVLACGGFEANPEMRLRYLGPGWDLVKVRGTRFNTGTMLSAALEAGAAPAGHWGGCHAVPLDASAPDVGDLRLTDKMSRYSYPYGILVNKAGRRFIDEGADQVWLTYARTGAEILAQPGAIAFQIFDQLSVDLLEPRYSTSTPIVAAGLPELAEACGIEPGALCATVEQFNVATNGDGFDPFALDGLRTDDGLAPPKSNWARPLDTPPFVAYPVTCGITFTYGGLATDADARVLDAGGESMPGLFAAGEIAGGFFYHNYPAGAGLMRGAVFGRIAGRAAAAYREGPS